MTIYLLDVNVLIALLDPKHTHAEVAGSWFEQIHGEVWATCPMTENGVIRIMSAPSYQRTSNHPSDHVRVLDRFCQFGGHHFWPDDISSRTIVASGMQLKSSDLADIYLLALAIEHGSKLATFDEKIPAHVLPGGVDALEVIPA